jgi:phosphonate transport system ATP-binding protein
MRPAALRQLRRRMGIVYQQHNLVPRLTAAQNVLLTSFGRMPFWRAALGLIHQSESQRRAAFEVLEELEIGDKLYARADDLSGGQQQRVAVARALLHTPELLLADEPIASVDAETAELILGLFRRLNHERGVTLVVSLHQSEFARRYCSRVLVLREGELTYDGPPSGIELHRLGEEGGLRERMGGRTGPPAGMQAGAASLFGGRV